MLCSRQSHCIYKILTCKTAHIFISVRVCVFILSAAPAVFYPFGLAAGDTEHVETGGESYYSVGLSTPFKFFGRTYNQIYVNYNGLLTFNVPSTSGPYSPTRGAEDFIAALWNDFDDDYSGVFSYQQYTNGSVLTRATQDINQYFSQVNINAAWVFVVTWRYALQPDPAILFQVVLISGSGQSYFLMNYGDCAVLYGQLEAGYDTINSTSYFVIPDSTNGNYQNLKNTSNVNVPGRWAFNAWAAPAIFYLFGSAAGDTEYSLTSDEGYVPVSFSIPYTFFGNTYNSLYVHFNGLLTFNQPQPASGPNYNPTRGAEDFIAALWSDLDDYYSCFFSYQQYTNGSVLTRATHDINQYFPQMNFTASWVFVVTWKYGPQQNPAILFQVVLISGGNLSFFLMNYGDFAVIYEQTEAGYDTINSIYHFVIPDSNNSNYQNLKNTTNVNVPGRWAFIAGNESVTTTPTTTFPSVNTTTTTAQPWTAPAVFYPFGLAAGDTEHVETGGESYYSVGLLTPFKFFGRTYNQIYVNYNGLLTFNVPSTSGPYSPTRGAEDFIAALWNDFDDYFNGVFSYQQYTNGSVLTRATQDINQYFSQVNINAAWVFVVTWRYALQPNPAILFQVVLISGSGQSYFLMNYGDCAVLYGQLEAGYDTINSISHFVIPDSTNGNYQNLKNTTNVNVPGRWAFNAWAAPAIFYLFGSAAGDTEYSLTSDEGYVPVSFSIPYTFFGHTYNILYVHFNGLLTFNQPQPASGPNYNPTRGAEDFIAALWSDLDDYYSCFFSYQQYTNGSVLTRATQDINQYFPQMNFTASWVFVVTWKYGPQQNPAILLQVVLISGGNLSFFLMNYGDLAVIYEQTEAGYDTINSIYHFVIPDSNNSNYQNLKNTTNVNVPGRWAFIAGNGSVTTTTTTTVSTTTTAQPWTAPAIFYPFGSAARDAERLISGDEAYESVALSTPYTFFGRTYNSLYVHYNGLITFNQPQPASGPYYYVTRGAEDFIAPLWSDLDDMGWMGKYWYQQYTSGSVLTRATQDINWYFPQMNFTASWVFVVTWDFVATSDVNSFIHHSAQAITFQGVLISGGNLSFFLIHYGDCAIIYDQVEAGYDTINSIHHFVIPGSNVGYSLPNLKNTSNVNVPGRWAFMGGSENVVGLQMRLQSFSDLTKKEDIETVLQQIKQELVNRELSSSVEMKLRKIKKTQP
uniref:NIDO domain-containing protein n=1 Tax=Cyprinus carpio carpio TaxID=630221 RepID=A0A9J7Y932_CYPCA